MNKRDMTVIVLIVFVSSGCGVTAGHVGASNHRMPWCVMNPTGCKPYKEARQLDLRSLCMERCSAGTRHMEHDARWAIWDECRDECKPTEPNGSFE